MKVLKVGEMYHAATPTGMEAYLCSKCGEVYVRPCGAKSRVLCAKCARRE